MEPWAANELQTWSKEHLPKNLSSGDLVKCRSHNYEEV
jgi:hypothetical protein